MVHNFSMNSFYLGMLFCACLCLSNIVYSLFCILMRVNILVFAVFNKLWFLDFALHSETVHGTKFQLGWLPWSTYIKPQFNATDETAKDESRELELSFFDSQPKYIKILFDSIPFLIYVTAFFITFFCIANMSNFGFELKSIYSYIGEAFTAMFSGESAKREFVNETRAITEGKNVLGFGFLISTVLMILTIPISGFLSQAMSKKSTILKWLSTIYFLGYLWILFWKIPQFVFSFFSLAQNIIYFISFITGIYLFGMLFYFTVFIFFKNISIRRAASAK